MKNKLLIFLLAAVLMLPSSTLLAQLSDYDINFLAINRVKFQEIENINSINNIDELNNIFFLRIFGGHFPIPSRYSVIPGLSGDAILGLNTHTFFDFSDNPNYETITLGEVPPNFFKRNSISPIGSINYYDLTNCDDCFPNIPFGLDNTDDEDLWYIVEVFQYEEIRVNIIEVKYTPIPNYVVMIYDDSNMLVINDENEDLWRASLEFLIDHRIK